MNANPKTAGKGIRNGAQYLADLRDDRDVWLRGEKVKDVTNHPTLGRGAVTLASFLDKQFDPALQDKITYVEDGVRYAMSFKTPNSAEDIKQRGEAFYEWATWLNGMFGRTPDYKNASVMAFAAAADFLTQGRPEFADCRYAGPGSLESQTGLRLEARPGHRLFRHREPPVLQRKHPDVLWRRQSLDGQPSADARLNSTEMGAP